jgi:hypothetical protein
VITGARPGWGLLLAVSVPAVAWPAVLGSIGAALAVAATLAVMPAVADAVLPVLAVIVLACGAAVAAEDATAPVTETAPVRVRRRFAARAVLVLPASAAGLTAVIVVAELTGVGPDPDLVLLWATLSALAAAVGAVARRAADDVPGPAAAAVVLVVGWALVTWLPEAVFTVPAWDSTGERVTIAGVVSLLLLAWATRDPAA